MNYKESQLILEEIKKAKRILVNCHRSPDPDSVASCLSIYQVLKGLNKDVLAAAPDRIHRDLRFLPLMRNIQKVDFDKFDYSNFDLFILLDSSSLDQATGVKGISLPEIKTIVIDHHTTNERYGDINLVNGRLGSTCELLYYIFQDWDIKIDKGLATTLLTGIISDTGSFQYSYTTPESLLIASNLIKLGADRQEIIFNLFNSYDFKLIKLWGEIIKRMKLEEEHKFVWVAIPYETFVDYGKPSSAKSAAASLFFSSVEDTDFGIVMVEQKKGVLSMSMRSRTDVDVSKIANELGGSGHKDAAGAWIQIDDFEKGVEKVLEVARKFSREKL